MPARTSLKYSASPVTLRSGLAAAIASTEWVCSRWITPFQLADSAKAPWTRTTVGLALGMAGLLRGRGCRAPRAARGRLLDGGSARWDVPAQPRGAHRSTTRKKPRRSALPRSRPPVVTRRFEQGPAGPAEGQD